MKHAALALCALTLTACSGTSSAPMGDPTSEGGPANTDPHVPDDTRPDEFRPDEARPEFAGAPARIAPDFMLTPLAPWAGSAAPWTSHPAHPFRHRFADGSFSRAATSADGSRMVAAGPEGLVVIDVGDAGATVVGSLELDGNPFGVALSADGRRAVVSTGTLHFIDLSLPSEPRVRAQFSRETVRSFLLSPDGNRVWAAGGQNLFTLDTTSLDRPFVMTSAPLEYIRGMSFGADGDVAFVHGYAGFSVLDLRAGEWVATELLGDELPSIYHIAAAPDGDTIFVASGRDYVAVDIRDLSAPRVLARTQHSGSSWTRSLTISPDGTTLFAVRDHVVDTFDIRDPNTLLHTASFELENAAAALPTADRQFAVVATGSGLTLLDLNNPGATAARTPSDIDPAACWNATDVQVAPDAARAFVAADSLLVFDITGWGKPSLKGRHEASNFRLAVAPTAGTSAETLFAASHGEALRTFDVRGDTPVEISEFNDPTAQTMDLVPTRDGQTLFLITEGGGGLDVMDISDLDAPERVAHFYVRHTESVVLSPDEAVVYIADPYENGLLAVDVRTPSEPAFLGRLPWAMTQLAMCQDGQTLLAGGLNGGLFVVDTREPSAMEIIGELAMARPTDMQISADCTTAYVTDGFSMRVVDLTRPEAPTIQGAFEVAGLPTGIALSSDGYTAAVVSDDADACLGLLDINPPTLFPTRGSTRDMRRFQLRWNDHYPQHAERFSWHTSAGEVVISEVDQIRNTATVEWAAPHGEPNAVLRVAVGNHQYYQVAEAVGGF